MFLNQINFDFPLFQMMMMNIRQEILEILDKKINLFETKRKFEQQQTLIIIK